MPPQKGRTTTVFLTANPNEVFNLCFALTRALNLIHQNDGNWWMTPYRTVHGKACPPPDPGRTTATYVDVTVSFSDEELVAPGYIACFLPVLSIHPDIGGETPDRLFVKIYDALKQRTARGGKVSLLRIFASSQKDQWGLLPAAVKEVERLNEAVARGGPDGDDAAAALAVWAAMDQSKVLTEILAEAASPKADVTTPRSGIG